MSPFLSSIISGISINIITAIIIWIIIERRSIKKEDLNNKLNNERIIKSELLSQYVSVLNTNNQMQYLAFKIADYRYLTPENTKKIQHEIMNDLRHIANTHSNLNQLLIDLGGDKDNLNPYAYLSNELACVSIELFRNNGRNKDVLSTYTNWYQEVKESQIINWENSTHLKRIEVLIGDLPKYYNNFEHINEKGRLNKFIDFGEAMGHISCLYSDAILISFNKKLKELD